MDVTIVVPEQESSSEWKTTASARVFFHVDEFSQDMSRVLSQEVPVYVGPLNKAPNSGCLLVFDVGSDDDLSCGARLISMSDDRSAVIDRLEQHSLAGAVEKWQYFQYISKKEVSFGIIGRREIAEKMSARIQTTGPYVSEHYVPVAVDGLRRLPDLLGAYLRIYAQSNPTLL